MYLVVKISLFQTEVQGYGSEHLNARFFQCLVNFQAYFPHFRELIGPDIVGVFLLNGVVIGYMLTHMIKLFEVTCGASLGVFFTFANVATLASQLRNLILGFDPFWQTEEFLNGGIQVLGLLIS